MLRLLQGNVPGVTRPKTQPRGRQARGHCTCAWPALLTAGDAKARGAAAGGCPCVIHMWARGGHAPRRTGMGKGGGARV